MRGGQTAASTGDGEEAGVSQPAGIVEEVEMIIGMVGSRRRDTLGDFLAAREAFNKVYNSGDTLVSGGCPKGSDRFAELIAISLVRNLSVEELFRLDADERADLIIALEAPIKLHRANWKLGKHAGFLRNTDIAQDAEVLIALLAGDRTGGTEDTVKKFVKIHKASRRLILA